MDELLYKDRKRIKAEYKELKWKLFIAEMNQRTDTSFEIPLLKLAIMNRKQIQIKKR